ERLADTAEAITAVSLDRRLAATGVETELLRLVTVFNEMLDRLERSFRQAVRFSADAAHELQTPLTILQGELEQALQTGTEADQELLARLLEEAQRLKAIVRKLLLLSRVDSGAMQPALHPVNLSQAAEGLREDAETLAPGLAVTASLAPDVWVMADADLLQQVLANLISNAIKYNRPDGSIDLRLAVDGPQARLSVRNTGPAIPPEDRELVFDRFYRADPARSRGVDGLGLGLSLAREIARLHGGDIIIASSDAKATLFVLTLPLKKIGSDPIFK
ncbi:MAG: two-component sensor histidine kinase, partial [Armatimonadetes bacterium]|nr:two-component sensor histidine kinase [Armatimonadota bacterium]